jgi:phosphoribosylcarboxyaminoimidazole (NCAIR) mutase
MAIGKAGTKNAALLAIRILALSDGALEKKLHAYVERMAEEVEQKQQRLTGAAVPGAKKH